jgi:hypothetical protein
MQQVIRNENKNSLKDYEHYTDKQFSNANELINVLFYVYINWL